MKREKPANLVFRTEFGGLYLSIVSASVNDAQPFTERLPAVYRTAARQAVNGWEPA